MVTVALLDFSSMRIRPPRAAFYERVSTDEQSERDTIRSQDIALHKRYDVNFGPDAKTPWVYVGTFRDDGVSGTIPLDQRPDGRRLMDLVRANEIDLICVARADRLARDRGVANAIADEFYDRDMGIESVNEHIDLTTPAGRLQFAIMCDFYHYEREIIRDRTMGGRETHAIDGEFINGPVPFGYMVIDNRLAPSTRVIEQLGCTEAELVCQMYERVAGGESALSLMRWLRAMGVPSSYYYYNKKTERYREVSNPLWQYPRIRTVLRDTTYYGRRELKYGKPGAGRLRRQVVPIVQSVPALVSKELWDRVDKALAGHISNFATEHSERYIYLLSGKVQCAECGYNMNGNYMKPRPGQRRKTYMYYTCTNRSPSKTNARRHGLVCKVPHVNGYALEEFMLRVIDDLVADPSQTLAALAEQQQQRYGAVAQQATRVKAIQQRLAGYERGRQALLDMVRTGDINQDEFRVQSAQAAEGMAAARRELAALEAEGTLAHVIDEQLQEAHTILDVLAEEWPKARAANDRADLRELLQPLVQKVVVHRDQSVDYTVLFNRTSDKSHLCDWPLISRTLVGFAQAAD